MDKERGGRRPGGEKMVKHLASLGYTTLPLVERLKGGFDGAYGEYVEACEKHQEMGMKAKVKLENVKQTGNFFSSSSVSSFSPLPQKT